MIRWGSRSLGAGVCLFFLLATAAGVRAELRPVDLALPRAITERDWLQLKLEVLGQRLSFPAYRVQVQLDSEGCIAFSFLACI